jgi:hypothetical protein
MSALPGFEAPGRTEIRTGPSEYLTVLVRENGDVDITRYQQGSGTEAVEILDAIQIAAAGKVTVIIAPAVDDLHDPDDFPGATDSSAGSAW